MKDSDKEISEKNVSYFGKSWKQTIGGFTKVYVIGTDRERGFQFGKLLSKEIKDVFRYYLAYMIRTEHTVPDELKNALSLEPMELKTRLVSRYGAVVKKRIEKYPQWMIAELEGMAEGADIDSFFLFLLNSIGDNAESLGMKQIESLHSENKSCCSIAFTGKNGNIYHGKNLDWIPVEEFIDLTCFQQRADEYGNWFALIGPPGLLNAYEYGMNSHGIGISLTGRFFRGKRANCLTLTNTVELQILRYAKNFEDVCNLYKTRTGFDRSDGLLISSKEDNGFRLFEVNPKGVTMSSEEDGKLFCTNTFVHPKFRQYNRHWGTVYEDHLQDPRYIRLQILMSENPQTQEDAFEILTDTSQPNSDRVFLGQATINRFITHVSALMIFPPPAGEDEAGIWIARDHSYAAYNEYSFFNFSGSPQKAIKNKPANDILNTETYKNFKNFMHLRETRYTSSPAFLIQEGMLLLQKEPNNPIFILFVAQTCFKNGNFKEALEILENHPVDWCSDYWYCMGKCKFELREYLLSKSYFTKAMELPSIDGFTELVKAVCLIQLIKVNEQLGVNEEVSLLKETLTNQLSKFATPNIGMPNYPFINNITEEMEQVVL